MKDSKTIQGQIAKQEKLVNKLEKQHKTDYKNLSDNMLVSQAEYFIAKEVLSALKNVLTSITKEQETIDLWKR